MARKSQGTDDPIVNIVFTTGNMPSSTWATTP